MNVCANPICEIETTNPKFCSSRCAAIVNNKKFPKRQVEPQNLCLDCGDRLSRTIGRRKDQYCMKCTKKRQIVEYGNKTKGESLREDNNNKRHIYTDIRNHGTRMVKVFGWKKNKCEWCDYDIRTQICHIKGIADFPDDALLSEINGLDNLIFLCPNCHLEMDKDGRTE